MSKKVKLLSICKPKQYKTISKNELVEDGKYLVYGANGVIGKSNKYTHENRTLMVTCRGATCGSLNISKPFSYINGNAMAFDSIDKNFDLMYLYYYLSSRGFNDAISGTAQPQITRENLKNIDVLELSLEKQKQIAKTLDKAQELIDLRKESIAKLDELAKSIFIDMFGDPVSNPKGWEYQNLEDIVTHDCPLSYGIVQPGDEFENGTPIVRPVDLGDLRFEKLKKTDPKISTAYKKTILHGDEILLSVRGTTGTLAMATIEFLNANVTRGIVPIRLKSKEKKLFVFGVLSSKPMQQVIQEKTYGATLKQINLSEVRKLKIINPSIDLQNKFASIIEKIEEQKSLYEQELEKLEENFQALLQQSFKE